MPVEIRELIIQAKTSRDPKSTIKIEGESFILTREDLDDLKEEIRMEIMEDLQQQIGDQLKRQLDQLMDKNRMR